MPIMKLILIIVAIPTLAWVAHAGDSAYVYPGMQAGFKYVENDSSNASRPAFFVQISDVHICDTTFKEKYFGKGVGIYRGLDPELFFNATVEEIVDLRPDFVVATGDLAVETRAFPIKDALWMYELFNSSIQPLYEAGIPFYPVIGNHDVVGVFNKNVDPKDKLYAKGMFKEIFNQKSTYYSFDQDGYHFIALDPNSYELWVAKTRSSFYEIDDQQMAWLENDLNFTSLPSIILLHEPTVDLINRAELLRVLREHDVKMIFAGHWHVNDPLNSSGIPEQVTSAICEGWWQGLDIGGEPGGYMVVALNGSQIDTFYRYTGAPGQINVIEPAEPLVKGNMKVKAQIWSKKMPSMNAWIAIDKEQSRKMNVTWQGLWYEAQTTIDTSDLSKGYHTARITAMDGLYPTSKEFPFKVTDEEYTPIGDLLSHPDVYMGKHPRIRGYPDTTVDLTVLEHGPTPVFRDDSGKLPYVLKYCQPLPAGENKTEWTATGQFHSYRNDTISMLLIQRDDACPMKISA